MAHDDSFGGGILSRALSDLHSVQHHAVHSEAGIRHFSGRMRVRYGRLASAMALAACLIGGTASAQAQQAPITPPNRSDLIPPEQRRDDRSVTLTVDGDFERAPCALDRPEFADIRFTVKGAQFNGLERVPGLLPAV